MPPSRLIATIVTAALAVVLLIPATSSAAARACAGASAVPAAGQLDRARAATRCLLNRVRRDHGLKPLSGDRKLRAASDRYSRQMVRHRFFGHVSAVTGSTVRSRVQATGFLRGARTFRIGENIAWGAGASSTPRQIVRAWMRSPGHRTNILDRRFDRIGVGIALGSPRQGYGSAATYTTDFGTRR